MKSKNDITLILPVAGKSSRFKTNLPKWLLESPDGNLMVYESISKLTSKGVNKIVIICLKSHIQEHIEINDLKSIFKKKFSKIKIEILVLNRILSSQAHTVSEAINKLKIKGQIFIKDSDNIFKHIIVKGNYVCSLNLNNSNLIDAKSKSYVELKNNLEVMRIVEKKVISNYFCTGGYSFEKAEDFNKYFYKIYKFNKGRKEIYISHVIQSMLLDGYKFYSKEITEYLDLGTQKEWFDNINNNLNIFCYVEGIITTEFSKFIKHKKEVKPLIKNLETLSSICKNQNVKLYLISSQDISFKKNLKKILYEYGIKSENIFLILKKKEYNSYSI